MPHATNVRWYRKMHWQGVQNIQDNSARRTIYSNSNTHCKKKIKFILKVKIFYILCGCTTQQTKVSKVVNRFLKLFPLNTLAFSSYIYSWL